jgi:hypothetical protein
MILFRLFHLAPTRHQALAEAHALLRPFVERMQATGGKPESDATPWLTGLIEDSWSEPRRIVRAKIEAIRRDLGPRGLVLKPLSPSSTCKAQLRAFAARPAVTA